MVGWKTSPPIRKHGRWTSGERQKLAKTLDERKNEAILYRNLSTLRTDVPIPDKLEDLEWRGASRDRVTSVVSAMDSPDLLERTIRYSA